MENQLTMAQLAEAHLMNVQREISQLNQRKSEIDVEIKRLTEYLNSGVDVIRQHQRSQAKPADATEVFKGE